jgi:hypothetical protein
MSNPNISLGNV